MSDPGEEHPENPSLTNNNPSRWVGMGMLALVVIAGVVFTSLNQATIPPPTEIADDPLLKAGYAVFMERCVSCHGPKGRGDGPIAKGLKGPPVGNLTDGKWKHGDKPEQVQGVIEKGIENTAMPGWGSTLGPDGVRAVAAYVYYLGGREVPKELRAP